MPYLDGLNDAQKRAVLTTKGPLSVLAGAGAGKTRVLTARIYHLIRNGVLPEQILAVTFTNKAAREMRERLFAMLGESETSPRGKNDRSVPLIVTFHGLGRVLLETYGQTLGLPRFFSVFNRDDSEKVIAKALKTLDVGAKELSPRVILSRISKVKGQGITQREYAERHGHASFSARITAEAWRLYEQTLREEKALDFDDLITLPVRLLETNEEVREAVSERFHYVHIDEYQDTNELQARLVELITRKYRNLFVVGDIDQTIYTWRGATIENLLSFEKTYPKAETIVLEHNYRATKTLVMAANGIIEKNKNRKEKHSITENETGSPIIVHQAFNAEDEATWIAKTIRARMREGISPEEIAVLFRTNFQSRALEEGLLHENIPYKLLGTRFFDRKEVRDMLAWLRLVLDKERPVDYVRAAGSPPRGLGKVTLGKLASGTRDTLRDADRAKVESFEKTITAMAEAAKLLSPSAIVKLVAEKSGMKRTLVDEGNDDDRERFENVEELASVAARFDSQTGEEGLRAFLSEVELQSDQDDLDRGAKQGVRLMTVHAAKGLEFNTVFVSGMEEGLFPHENMNPEEERDDEEERRLFYVAVTRAKRRLFLTLAHIRKIYGTDYISLPSSFLSDIDPSLIVYDESDGEEIIEA